MRIKHVLWLVGNGWIRTPNEFPHLMNDREGIRIFNNLRQFSDWCDRENKKQSKLQPTETKTT